jgi:hypothetical protein
MYQVYDFKSKAIYPKPMAYQTKAIKAILKPPDPEKYHFARVGDTIICLDQKRKSTSKYVIDTRVKDAETSNWTKIKLLCNDKGDIQGLNFNPKKLGPLITKFLAKSSNSRSSSSSSKSKVHSHSSSEPVDIGKLSIEALEGTRGYSVRTHIKDYENPSRVVEAKFHIFKSSTGFNVYDLFTFVVSTLPDAIDNYWEHQPNERDNLHFDEGDYETGVHMYLQKYDDDHIIYFRKNEIIHYEKKVVHHTPGGIFFKGKPDYALFEKIYKDEVDIGKTIPFGGARNHTKRNAKRNYSLKRRRN